MTVTVGIAGFTGKFSRLLTNSLLKYSEAKIVGYCRTPSKVSSALSSSPQISIKQGEAFDGAALRSFARGCDIVVCGYLGDSDFMLEGQKALIDACEDERVSRYVASDWSLDYTKVAYGELPQKDPMKRVKEYIETGDKKIRGVHVLVGGFMEVLLFPRFGIFDPTRNVMSYWGDGDEIFESSTYQTAAEYTAAICMDPNAVGVQRGQMNPTQPSLSNAAFNANLEIVLVLGDSQSTKQLAATFEKVYGVKPTLERRGSLDELFKTMKAAFEKNPSDIYSWMFLFVSLFPFSPLAALLSAPAQSQLAWNGVVISRLTKTSSRRYYYYYMASGKTLVGPDLDNDKYPSVKPTTFEDLMRSTPREKLGELFFNVAQ